MSAPAVRPQADHPWLVERTRTALTAHWRPWTVGHWKLGASMGLHRALPGTSVGSGTLSSSTVPARRRAKAQKGRGASATQRLHATLDQLQHQLGLPQHPTRSH